MKRLIYTDDRKLTLQKSYNEAWVDNVNATIEALKAVAGEGLTDEQLNTFLTDPAKLGEELTEKAKAEYDEFVNTLPQSVKLSMSFNDGGKVDAIKAMHKSLMAKRPYQIIDKTTIADGLCVMDEEALKNECSVFGGAESKKIYDKAVECAKLLNELDALIHLNPVGAECVENFGRWNGIINFQYDKKASKYSVNAELLPLLDKDKE